jgi:hypothetical protein
MAGTFEPGDWLTIQPAPISAIRRGDVVACRMLRAENAREMVHRVVAVTPGGLVTRGDNNPEVDSELASEPDLVGIVTHVERDGVTRRVRGGRSGWWRVQFMRAWRRLRRLGRRPYRWLAASGFVRRLWRPDILRLQVEAPGGLLVKFTHRGRVVARFWPMSGRFECRKPYDLVINRPDGAR